jgi:hypothetical protein
MVVSLWITVGLVIASTAVASLGAYFSIHGLGLLFSGAVVAVWAMAGSLEFAKFILAAYLHQTWKQQNLVFKSYLSFAIVVLSIITSVGIYGFLSDAYTSASAVLETETVKLEGIQAQQKTITAEIKRLNAMVDEIPANRISRRLKMRAEIEPVISELQKKYVATERLITESNLKVIEVKKQVGPLIYIARNYDMNIDRVVSYLILIFVLVFDPLAICLVIASTHAIASRTSTNIRRANAKAAAETAHLEREAQIEINQAENLAKAQAANKESDFRKPKLSELKEEVPFVENKTAATDEFSQDIIVQMNFKDEKQDKKTV